MAPAFLKGPSSVKCLSERLSEIYRGMVPFMILQGVGLLLVFFFPQLATWPPKRLFRG
jgi:TRAP-type mannitol/chloroaromatic compound transport system permease large subunit